MVSSADDDDNKAEIDDDEPGRPPWSEHYSFEPPTSTDNIHLIFLKK